jgi:hypothetical protein
LATGTAHGTVLILDNSDLTGFSQAGSRNSEGRADAQSGNWGCQNATGGGGGTTLIADAVRLELVPEPAAALIGGLGILILLLRRRVG